MHPCGLGHDHRANFALRRQSLLQQMHAFGHRIAVFGKSSPRHGAADLLDQRVLVAEGVHYNDSKLAELKHMKRPLKSIAALILVLAAAAGLSRVMSVARDIRRQSMVDDVQPADVIVVLGAAEYSGKPSPILEARLNHALFLYRQQWAPRILTTGGAGGDPTFTEGEVGRAYLSSHGIPSEAIITETDGSSTVESTVA